MHLDDSYVKLATALLQLGSAYLALRQVRFLKKSESRRRTSTRIRLFKKINSVPRGMRNSFKKNGNRLTHNPVAFFKKPSHVLILGAGFSHQKKLA